MAADENERILRVPLNFTSIQAALNNASSGDTIIVAPGLYRENLVIGKNVTLMGEDRDTTIVDGAGLGDTISIKSDLVTIKDLTVVSKSTGAPVSGIVVDHHNGVIVDGAVVSGTSYAMSLIYCSNSVFSNNIIVNSTFGIQLVDAIYNVFSNNTISGNDEGITFDYINNNYNVFFGNTLSGNGEGAVIRQSSLRNSFYHNNFIDQIMIETDEANFWSRSGEGNYWGSYKGQDLHSGPYQNESGSDGIADESYQVGTNNRDDYPLMGTFSEFEIPKGNQTYQVNIICNSTTSNLRFETGRETGNRMITFDANGPAGSEGFCRMMISTSLMDYPYSAIVNEGQANVSLLYVSNVTNAYLYFTYPNDKQTVTVISSVTQQLYSSLLDKYNNLQNDFDTLNTTYQGLLTSYNSTLQALINNFGLLLNNLTQLEGSYLDLESSLQKNVKDQSDSLENMRNLAYVFAALTGAFLITTAYLSTRAHSSKHPKVPVSE